MRTPDCPLLLLGVIGAGFISQVAHLPAFTRQSRCRVVALADNRPDVLSAVANRFDIADRYEDHLELTSRGDLDAIIVAAPRRAQSAIVREVLTAHRSVLTEKPMAYTARVAQELGALARSAGVVLAVGYTRLHDPGVVLFQTTLDQAVASGEMGEVLHARMTDFCGAYTVAMPDHIRGQKRRLRYAEDPVVPSFLDENLAGAYDYTINVASHDINLLHLLFGALQPVSFRVRRGGAQHALLATPSIDVDLAVGPAAIGSWEQRLDVYFQKGCLSLVLDSSLARQSTGVVVRRRVGGDETLRPPIHERAFAFDLQAAAFLDTLASGAGPTADGSDATRDSELIEELWRIAMVAP